MDNAQCNDRHGFYPISMPLNRYSCTCVPPALCGHVLDFLLNVKLSNQYLFSIVLAQYCLGM